MKSIFLMLTAMLLFSSCKQEPKQTNSLISDGFYEVMKLSESSVPKDSLKSGQVAINFDPLFNPGDYTMVAIDTNDYVPLELETEPTAVPQTESKKLLSITLTAGAAEKIKTFTAQRIMKEAVVVIDGKAITMHKIREAITGPEMQITRCDDNACEYLYVKMKGNIKK